MRASILALFLVFWALFANAAAPGSADDPAPAEQEQSACATPEDVGNPGCDEVDSEEEPDESGDEEEEEEDDDDDDD